MRRCHRAAALGMNPRWHKGLPRGTPFFFVSPSAREGFDFGIQRCALDERARESVEMKDTAIHKQHEDGLVNVVWHALWSPDLHQRFLEVKVSQI